MDRSDRKVKWKCVWDWDVEGKDNRESGNTELRFAYIWQSEERQKRTYDSDTNQAMRKYDAIREGLWQKQEQQSQQRKETVESFCKGEVGKTAKQDQQSRSGVVDPEADVEAQKHQREESSGNHVNQCCPLSSSCHSIQDPWSYNTTRFITDFLWFFHRYSNLLWLDFWVDFFILVLVFFNPIVVDPYRSHEVDNCSLKQNQTDEGQASWWNQIEDIFINQCIIDFYVFLAISKVSPH